MKSISCEAAKDQAEYIRDGLRYDLWMNNIHRVLKESNVSKVHMMMTINALCLTTITEFMDEMLDLREEYGRRAPTMTLNILRFPSFQSCAIIPVEIKSYYKDKLQDWFDSDRPIDMLTDAEKESIQRLIDYLDIVKTPHKNTADMPKLYNDFKAFFAQYDIRRNKNFVETFPGPFAEWFESIDAVVPTREQIENKEIMFVSDRAGDPATTEEYAGGDDEHEHEDYSEQKFHGGWDTETDGLGGISVDEA